MKYLITALLLIAGTASAQSTRKAEYTVTSSKEVRNAEGVHVTINVRVKGSPDDHTVTYWFKDHDDRAVRLYTSDKKDRSLSSSLT